MVTMERFIFRRIFPWVVLATGCSTSTEPRLVADFTWTEADPLLTQEGMTASAVLGELFVLGHVFTPARCFRLDHSIGQRGFRLEVVIRARATATPNCDPAPGAYRYTLGIYNLRAGTYQLQVTHDVAGKNPRVFTENVVLR